MTYNKKAVLTADRSLPRKSIVMLIRPREMAKIPEPVLPQGYSFRLYRAGDAENWARIALRVEEAETMEEGLRYFESFLREEEESKRRVVFVISPDGTAVATAAAWYFEENGKRYGRVHWIMNDPAHQGKGIGRAIVAWAVRRIAELETGLDTYLDTQTWSHKAIGLYMRMGFHACRETHPVLKGINEYTAAAAVLRESGVMPEEVLSMFTEGAAE